MLTNPPVPFNQEKALVGAFSVIVKTGCEADGSFYSTTVDPIHCCYHISREQKQQQMQAEEMLSEKQTPPTAPPPVPCPPPFIAVTLVVFYEAITHPCHHQPSPGGGAGKSANHFVKSWTFKAWLVFKLTSSHPPAHPAPPVVPSWLLITPTLITGEKS